jgi:hypothetical protein
MANNAGNAYGLTVLSPIKNADIKGVSCVDLTRNILNGLALNENSPMAAVPNTYFARFYIINDVFFENLPHKEDHLKSKYLGFSTNFHGDLETYLTGMWTQTEEAVRTIWQHCVIFNTVNSASDFIEYIKKCQLNINLFFNGSTDDSLEQQLKALYLKQQFAQFAADHQGLPAAELQIAFKDFWGRVQPRNLAERTWQAGREQ